METKKDISEELINISPFLAAIPKRNLFSVPAGYFDSFSDSLQLNINENYTLSENFKHNLVFEAIPENYLANLSNEILEKIKAEEALQNMDEISHHSILLSEFKNKSTFVVPEGYFETLSQAILGKIKTTFPTTKVVSIKNYRIILKYAVAAIFIGIVSLSTNKFIDKSSDTGIKPVITVATLDATIEAGKNMSDQQFNEKLNNLSSDDIAKYLEKNSNETDIALLTIDGELPEKDALLPNELDLQKDLTEIITKN